MATTTVAPQVGREQGTRWDAVLCAVAVLAVFLLARPYVEIGMSDDFSYVKTAWVFAQTGKFVYNGWATAMLGWQIPWAAPFIKVLGPTWFACRLSVTVLLVLCVFVAHAVARRAGLNRGYAAFATLVVCASPLMLALSATFMTDTGGLLVILLALLCGMRALRARTDAAVLGWLALGFAVGAVGGTSRQIAWMCSLVMMPSAAWMLRRRKGVVALSAVGWVVSLVVMMACLRWFNHQPLSVPEPLIQGKVSLQSVRTLADRTWELGMCTVFLLLPVWAAGVLAAVRAGAKAVVAGVVGGCLLVLAAWVFLHNNLTNGWMPWVGDWLARMDLLRMHNMWSYGEWPATLSKAGRMALSWPVGAAFGLFVVAVAKNGRRGGAVAESEAMTWRELLWLIVPFLCSYMALLVPRELWSIMLDRYFLPLAALAAFPLLRLAQERFAPRVDRVAWAALLVMTAWGVAGLHDWIAGFRARTEAVARLEAAGIPVEKIRAGFELDGLTQINKTGAVVDPRVKFPAGFDTHSHRPAGLPAECEDLYHPYTPTLEPEYWLTYDPRPCLAPTEFGEVDYRAWLPPFKRKQLILKLSY